MIDGIFPRAAEQCPIRHDHLSPRIRYTHGTLDISREFWNDKLVAESRCRLVDTVFLMSVNGPIWVSPP